MDALAPLQRQVKMARYMLLGTVIITVVNLALMMANSELYIIYFAAVPYYLGWFGWLLDGGTVGQMTVIGLVLAGIVLAVYLLVWFLAAERPLWLKVGLGLLIADTLALLGLAFFLSDNIMDFFWELALHGAVLYEMILGVSAQKKLDAQPQQNAQI